MDLNGILSISGKPGLYKHISQTKNGIIVESLVDKKRMPAYASAKISALEDIAIYTEDEDMPLNDVFKRIFETEDGKETLGKKATNDELKTYFEEVLPEYDKERVYVSDLKKIINWYNLLVNLGLMEFSEEKKKQKRKKKKSLKKKKRKLRQNLKLKLKRNQKLK
jgi:uncharacterized protein DUF6852/uncharacterized protein DUF5606